MNIKLLAIAPYEGLKTLIEDVSKKFNGVSVDVFTANLQSGASFLKSATAKNYFAVISRGGTATLLKKYSNLPIIEIPISEYDILRAIKLAQSYSGKFAFVGFPNITNSAEVLSDILNTNYEIITVNSSDEVDNTLMSLKDRVDLIIGDVITSAKAEKMGYNTILITSGENSVSKAIQDAIDLKSNLSMHSSLYSLLTSSLEQMPEIISIFDGNENNIYNNLSGEKLEYIDILEEMKKAIPKNLEQIKLYKKINGASFKITSSSFIYQNQQYTAFFASLQRRLNVSDSSFLAIRNPNDETLIENDYLFKSNVYLRPLKDKIEKIEKSSLPVFIFGETGTGKESIANIIYKNSQFSNAPLYIVNCDIDKKNDVEKFFSSHDSPIFDSGYTFYFKNIEQLPTTYQDMLRDCFRYSSFAKRHKVIFSSRYDLKQLINNLDFNNELFVYANPLSVYLPPLNARKEDIPDIITLCINNLNITLGKNIVGLEAKAMELMQNYNWSFNVNQLQLFLRQLVTIATSSYISRQEVEELFIKTDVKTEEKSNEIDLTKSLSEIDREVVMKVLRMNNMNQSKTADKLGISRSTLWRLLKNLS